jgi:hypothetical protein
VPGALCRELPLGTGCAESKRPCAEWVRLSAEAPIPVVSICCSLQGPAGLVALARALAYTPTSARGCQRAGAVHAMD